MPKKPKYQVDVDCCKNGVMVTIKKGKEVLAIRVFEERGKKDTRWIKWVDDFLKMEENKK